MVSLHPGVTRETVQAQCGWPLRFADDVGETPPPTDERARRAPRTAGAHRARPRRRGRMSRDVYICDTVRTPIGRYGGALAKVRADDLAAIPIRALLRPPSRRSPRRSTRSILGCANQAGEDNRNVARMALLLAGLPGSVPGTTHEPALRLRARRGRRRGPRHPRRRDRPRDRRRGRVDDARAAGHGQGRGGLPAHAPRSTTRPSAGASSTR